MLSVQHGVRGPQALVEGLLKEYPNTLVLRVRMPIVADLTYPRNFITKIIKYDKVRPAPPWSGARPAPSAAAPAPNRL